MSQAKDKLVQSKEEVIKQIEQYAPDIRHKLRLGKSPFEIKTWLNEKGVYAPHYFLIEQIEKLKITSTGKLDFKEGKAIIAKEDERYKECSNCKELKPLSAFDKDKKSKDGYQYWCKECSSNYGKDPEITPEEKQIIINKERFSKIRELILSKDEKYIRALEVKPIIPTLDIKTHYKLLANFEEEGLIVSGKDPEDKRKKIYWLPEEPFKDNISSDEQLNDPFKEKIPEEHRAPSEDKQPDFKDQLESKKIDLYKMFAAGIPIPEIKEWLNEWEIYPPYDALIKFQEEHKSSIESLEKIYKTGISGLKEDIYGFLGIKEALWENRKTYDELVAENKRLLNQKYLENKFKKLQKSPDTQKLYIPSINELSEIFNLPEVNITFNCPGKDSFLWICKTLNDHSIDFDILAESEKGIYKILVYGEEAE